MNKIVHRIFLRFGMLNSTELEFDRSDQIKELTKDKNIYYYLPGADTDRTKFDCYNILSLSLDDKSFILFISTSKSHKKTLAFLSELKRQRSVNTFGCLNLPQIKQVDELESYIRQALDSRSITKIVDPKTLEKGFDLVPIRNRNQKVSQKKHIAIQATSLTTSPHSGTARFLRELISGASNSNHLLTLLIDSKAVDSQIADSKNLSKFYSAGSSDDTYQINNPDTDLFHQPNQLFNIQEFQVFSRYKRKIISMLDLILFKCPHYFSSPQAHQIYQEVTQKTLQAADKIHAISEANKQDIVKTLQVDPEKVVVIYPGIDFNTFSQTLVSSKTSRKLQLLYVGTDFPHKNTLALVKGFLEYVDCSGDTKTKLVLILKCFPNGDKSKIDDLISHSNLLHRIEIITEFINDTLLAEWYHTSSLHVNLSEYEGFGFTPLEAGAAKLPSLLYANPAFKETMQSSAFFCNSLEPFDVANTLHDVLAQPLKLIEMGEKAQTRARLFTWSRFNNELFELYDSVLKDAYAPKT